MENLSGRQFGAYRVVSPLGEGGMASVFKGFQPGVERYVALKFLSSALNDDPTFLQRFRHEARILAQLQHPHILPVFDFGESDGYRYLVMPLVEGGTLAKRLRSERPSLATVAQVIVQLGDALDYAHSKGIVHRDLKPSNVLLDERGNCVLADFGIARMAEGMTRLTHSGMFMGTPEYMSPEQAGGETVGPASDIYSLGIMLYEMLTGRVPFKADTPVALAIKHLTAPLPPPSTVNPTVTPAVEAVVLKALARAPDDRYASALHMSAAFARALQSTDAQLPLAVVHARSASAGEAPTIPIGVQQSPTAAPAGNEVVSTVNVRDAATVPVASRVPAVVVTQAMTSPLPTVAAATLGTGTSTVAVVDAPRAPASARGQSITTRPWADPVAWGVILSVVPGILASRTVRAVAGIDEWYEHRMVVVRLVIAAVSGVALIAGLWTARLVSRRNGGTGPASGPSRPSTGVGLSMSVVALVSWGMSNHFSPLMPLMPVRDVNGMDFLLTYLDGGLSPLYYREQWFQVLTCAVFLAGPGLIIHGLAHVRWSAAAAAAMTSLPFLLLDNHFGFDLGESLKGGPTFWIACVVAAASAATITALLSRWTDAFGVDRP